MHLALVVLPRRGEEPDEAGIVHRLDRRGAAYRGLGDLEPVVGP
jgi:hypothetical protein